MRRSRAEIEEIEEKPIETEMMDVTALSFSQGQEGEARGVPTLYASGTEGERVFQLIRQSVERGLSGLDVCPGREDIEEIAKALDRVGGGGQDTVDYKTYKEVRGGLSPRAHKHLSSVVFFHLSTNGVVGKEKLIRHLEKESTIGMLYEELKRGDKSDTGWVPMDRIGELVERIGGERGGLDNETAREYREFVMMRIRLAGEMEDWEKIELRRLGGNSGFIDFVESTIFGFGMDLEEFLQFLRCVGGEGTGTGSERLRRHPGYHLTEGFCKRVEEWFCPEVERGFGWIVLFFGELERLGKRHANERFFDVMDVDGDGEITKGDAEYFQREMIREYEGRYGHECPMNLKSVELELMDICGKEELRVSREEFGDLGEAKHFVMTLCDLKQLEAEEEDENL